MLINAKEIKHHLPLETVGTLKANEVVPVLARKRARCDLYF